jgi:hypothetical protein
MTGDHITGFASELVQMAQAMARVPQLERDLNDANTQVEAYAKQVQRLEMKLMDRASEIETLKAAKTAAEVERDTAEHMFLEADDAKGTLVRVLDSLGKDILGALQAAMPIAKPTAEPVIQPPAEVHVLEPRDTFQGVRSSPSPFADTESHGQPDASSHGGTGEAEGGQAVTAVPTSSDSAPTQHGTTAPVDESGQSAGFSVSSDPTQDPSHGASTTTTQSPPASSDGAGTEADAHTSGSPKPKAEPDYYDFDGSTPSRASHYS